MHVFYEKTLLPTYSRWSHKYDLHLNYTNGEVHYEAIWSSLVFTTIYVRY